MNKVDRNTIITEVVENICQNCKSCQSTGVDTKTGQRLIVKASHCRDGSGYVDITICDENGNYIDSCKLQYPGDPCLLPYNVEFDEEPNCDCEGHFD